MRVSGTTNLIDTDGRADAELRSRLERAHTEALNITQFYCGYLEKLEPRYGPEIGRIRSDTRGALEAVIVSINELAYVLNEGSEFMKRIGQSPDWGSPKGSMVQISPEAEPMPMDSLPISQRLETLLHRAKNFIYRCTVLLDPKEHPELQESLAQELADAIEMTQSATNAAVKAVRGLENTVAVPKDWLREKILHERSNQEILADQVARALLVGVAEQRFHTSHDLLHILEECVRQSGPSVRLRFSEKPLNAERTNGDFLHHKIPAVEIRGTTYRIGCSASEVVIYEQA